MKNVIEYHASNGCIFTAVALNLDGGVKVINQFNCSVLKMATDYAEFGVWFGVTVHPRLDSFRGFDCITFRPIEKKS